MINWKKGSIAIATCALMASPLFAQGAAADQDVECLFAISLLQGSDDPGAKAASQMGGMYFAGKIFGADPGIDLKAALLAVARTAEDRNIPAVLQRCGGEMQTRGQQIQDAGQYLVEQGY